MGTLPPDMQEKIKRLSEATHKTTGELMARLKEILATNPTIATMEKEAFKIRFAVSMLYKEHATGGNDCFVSLLTVPRTREVNMKDGPATVGEVYALVQRISKDEEGNIKKEPVQYGAGTFWREAAKNASKCVPGKVYKASLIVKDNKWGVDITSNQTTFTEVKDHKMPSIQEFYDEKIKPKIRPIGIADIDINKSDYKTEIRVIEATVQSAAVGETEGREWGRYDVYDDSIMEKMGSMPIFLDPSDIKWMQGSVLLFGGNVEEITDKKTGKVRNQWNTHFVLPAGPDLAEPFKASISTKKNNEVELDLGEETSEEAPKSSDELDFSF